VSTQTFTIRGKIKPYVRMTQRSKWVRGSQAQEYLASKTAIGMQLKNQKRHNGDGMFPRQTPLAAYITIWEPRGFHNKDLDNQIKAILDSAQGIVFPDDRWIDRITAERLTGGGYVITLRIETL